VTTLGHLPQRTTALRQLVRALAPGGVLLTGDLALAPGALVMSAPDDRTADVLSRYVTAHVRARGGGAGCRLLRAGLPQLRTGLLAHGFTDGDLATAADALTDPRVLLNGFLCGQTTGRSPV
jgi:hypothetical protein